MKFRIAISSSIIAALGIGLLSANVSADTTSTSGQTNMSSQSISENNKATGVAFLSSNKAKPGVKTLPDGLQYKVITPGSGPHPTTSDLVTVDYAGKLINGTEFDSSYKRGEPTNFPVGAVIKGWVEALQLMSPGATWEIYIPSDLAYGDQGAPPSIGPNETLIFKVHLISINKS